MTKNICALIILTVLTGCINKSIEGTIAKVNVAELETILLEKVFSIEENRALKDKYGQAKKAQKAATEKMMQQYRPSKDTGKVEIDTTKMHGGYDLKDLKGYREIEKTVKTLIRDELTKIIKEKYEKQYRVVLEVLYQENVLFSEFVIPDITSDIRTDLYKNTNQE